MDKELVRRAWKKQRTLMLSSRGVLESWRHLQRDLETLMPHSKREPKLDTKKKLNVINEICDMRSCENSVFFEGRKKKDLYMWVTKVPNGPSVRFRVTNIHTMRELKMTGNCLKGSRPLVYFDPAFEKAPQNQLMKELLSQAFHVPRGHPKSKPFIDHVMCFYLLDEHIWFRNYEIVGEELVEIGPRLVMEPVKIFAGSYGGSVIWENPNQISRSEVMAMHRVEKQKKYGQKLKQQKKRERKEKEIEREISELEAVFDEEADPTV
jgi:ribosome biogenesis protein BRX1